MSKFIETVSEFAAMPASERIYWREAASQQLEENYAGGLPDDDQAVLLAEAQFDLQALSAAEQKLRAQNS